MRSRTWVRRLIAIIAALIVGLQVGPTQAQMNVELYSEDFTGSEGSMTIVSDGDDVTWHYRDDCASNLAGGHSNPGALRWGNINSCLDYDPPGASADDAISPSIDLSACLANTTLSFNYYINFQEPGSFEEANVQIDVMMGVDVYLAAGLPGSPGGTGQLSLINDNVLNNPNPVWNAATIDLVALLGSPNPGSIELMFTGLTEDSVGNTGNGFVFDDVVVSCDVPEAAPSVGGVGSGEIEVAPAPELAAAGTDPGKRLGMMAAVIVAVLVVGGLSIRRRRVEL